MNLSNRPLKLTIQGFMKDCPTGKLSRNEFIRIYIEFFPHGNPRNFAEWVFNVFDESNKGTICFSKFIRAVSITSHGSLGKDKFNKGHGGSLLNAKFRRQVGMGFWFV